MCSPSTSTHGPPSNTLSVKPASVIKLLTASSSVPGCSQSAGIPRLLASFKTDKVILKGGYVGNSREN